MADDGRSRDKKLLNHLQSKKLNLIIFLDDDPIEKQIKNLMNEYVNLDWVGYLKYNQNIHKQHKIEIKINQLRIKNWYFKPIEIISIQEYRRKKLIKLSQE